MSPDPQPDQAGWLMTRCGVSMANGSATELTAGVLNEP
jgi:hypothetical protein